MLYDYLKPTSKLNLIISDQYERINSSTFDFNITIIASDYKKNNRTSFVVLPNLIDAQKYYDSLYNILEEDVLFYPVDETTKNDQHSILMDYFQELATQINSRNFSGIIQSIITDLPKQAEAMQDIIDNFDKEKYQNVLNFAKAANGGREIE